MMTRGITCPAGGFQIAKAAVYSLCLVLLTMLHFHKAQAKSSAAPPPSEGYVVILGSNVILSAASGILAVHKCGAKELVCVELRTGHDDTEVELKIVIADDWHINAHEPIDDYLIPTSLAVDNLGPDEIIYPDATIKSLSFSDAPLALYEGTFYLRARKPSSYGDHDLKAVLTFQACSEDICLPPEDLDLMLK